LRAGAIDRGDRRACPRSRDRRRRGQRRRRKLDRGGWVGLAGGSPARNVGDRAATRLAQRRVLCGRLPLRSGSRRAAADRARRPVQGAAVPRCRRHGRHEDEDKQEQDGAAHLALLHYTCAVAPGNAPSVTLACPGDEHEHEVVLVQTVDLQGEPHRVVIRRQARRARQRGVRPGRALRRGRRRRARTCALPVKARCWWSTIVPGEPLSGALRPIFA
jgi:hypothetical protein